MNEDGEEQLPRPDGNRRERRACTFYPLHSGGEEKANEIRSIAESTRWWRYELRKRREKDGMAENENGEEGIRGRYH